MFKVKIRNQIRTLSGEGNITQNINYEKQISRNEQGYVSVKLNMANWNWSELDDVEMIDGFLFLLPLTQSCQSHNHTLLS